MNEIGGDPGASPLAGGWHSLLDRADRLTARLQEKLPLPDVLPSSVTLSARGLILAITGLVLLLVLPPIMAQVLRRTRMMQSNFRGDRIPNGFGLVIVLWAGFMLWWSGRLIPVTESAYRPYLLTVLGFGLLGLYDDLRGDQKTRGLLGHLRALFCERKVTTGLIKAAGGGIFALWIGHMLHTGSLLHTLCAAGLIALGANAINLLDVRPGRAGACFLLCGTGLLGAQIAQAASSPAPPLLFVLVPALIVWERDARATVMMGDTGSNLLGATLGLAAAQTFNLTVQGVLLTLLIALHLLTERVSLSRIIESNRCLRFLDRLTGLR
ncbi:MAG: hypothetical protein RMJ43_06895 [Chloroherpetonaceae bacterium]|nr:hypothetical protein [Chthonomonadaceae bacterium]MDW8207548.1 hypothetical protein [Chloroherpetonaceae bacterium]